MKNVCKKLGVPGPSLAVPPQLWSKQNTTIHSSDRHDQHYLQLLFLWNCAETYHRSLITESNAVTSPPPDKRGKQPLY